MSKLTKHQRQELKALVVNAIIRRLTSKETSAFIYEQLGISITEDYVRRLRMDLKHDGANELQSLQKDRDYYLKSMFWDRLSELEYQQKVLHSVIDKNEHNPGVQIKAVHELHSITVDINRAYQGLTVLSTYYIPTPTPTPIPFNGNNMTQQLAEKAKEKLVSDAAPQSGSNYSISNGFDFADVDLTKFRVMQNSTHFYIMFECLQAFYIPKDKQ
jgi:hypothetical protein